MKTAEGVDIPMVTAEEAEIDKDGVISGTPQIRKFKDVDLQAYIDKHVATLEPGDHGAVIAYVTTDGAKIATVGRKQLEDGTLEWTVGMTAPFEGGVKAIKAEGAVRYRW